MVKAIVGANWGDEGKGKITDTLAEKADIVVRFQGGANAGHTIKNKYGKFALHTCPSGVFNQNVTNIIGNGVALNVPVLMKEIDDIIARGVPKPKLLVSDRAQLVMPYHVLFDQYEEERLGGKSFGSTKSGIAPFYSDKYAKTKIEIKLETENGTRILFRDFGPGIPDEEIPFITGKFYRGKNSANENGSGLGLYIVQELVQKMGGKIKLLNKDPGFEVIITLQNE